MFSALLELYVSLNMTGEKKERKTYQRNFNFQDPYTHDRRTAINAFKQKKKQNPLDWSLILVVFFVYN